MITHVRSVTVYVSDQQRAMEWYRDALGCTIVADQPMGDGPGAPRWIEAKFPKDDLVLILFTPPGQESQIGSDTRLVVSCDDMMETHAELVAKGVQFGTEPKVETWGTWWATFRDPDGNLFGLVADA